MPKYLFNASYTLEGVRGLMKEGGSARKAVVERAIKSLGGSLESMYFAFGDADAVLIADLPDNATAAAISLIAGAAGGANVSTTVLLTPEEMDAAAKKQADYSPPGG